MTNGQMWLAGVVCGIVGWFFLPPLTWKIAIGGLLIAAGSVLCWEGSGNDGI